MTISQLQRTEEEKRKKRRMMEDEGKMGLWMGRCGSKD